MRTENGFILVCLQLLSAVNGTRPRILLAAVRQYVGGVRLREFLDQFHAPVLFEALGFSHTLSFYLFIYFKVVLPSIPRFSKSFSIQIY
jgi:hypothetical protein